MSKLHLVFLRKEEAIRIKCLIERYEFGDYRRYRILKQDSLREYLYFQLVRLFENAANNRVVIAQEDNEPLGLITFIRLPWDSKILGIEAAKIGHLIVLGDIRIREKIKTQLLSSIISLSRRLGITHLSCRIDVDDLSSAHALESNGFLLMDTLVTYTFNRYRHKIPGFKELCKIRAFKKSDLPVLEQIGRSVFIKDRFHLDHHILRKKADALFAAWVKNCCRGKDADRIFVAEQNKQPVGFLAFELNGDLVKFTGYKIAGHGLSAISPGAKGIYPSLTKAATQEIALNYDCLEFDTQLNNYEVLRVWQSSGFDFIRAKYTFHKWLG